MSTTATRVYESTEPRINQRIQNETEARISAFKQEDKEALITQRLNALDREWDIERTLQTNFAVFSLLGLALGTGVNRKWLVLATAVPAFMVQHAIQGWCPPLTVLRRLGFRTSKEINEERFALKALRGDFLAARKIDHADSLLRAVRK
jgi:hypothetical protein